MAGTVTTTEETFGSVKKITFDWLSSAGGAADATTTNVYSGIIERVVTVPDSGGTAPATIYALVLQDDDSVDILDGAGAGRSITATQQIDPGGNGAVANAKLTLGITTAGSGKGGTVYVYLR